MIKCIKHKITTEMAQHALRIIELELGPEEIRGKFSQTVFDLEYAMVKNCIFTLAQLCRVAEHYEIKEVFLAELRQIDSVVTVGRYSELAERYLGLMIVEVEFANVNQALPEHRVLAESNPDWTLRTKQGEEFYLEVSSIQIRKVIDDLEAFRTRIPVEKIIRSNSEPLYFEVIFPDNPRNYDPAAIGRRIADLGRNMQLPFFVQDDDLSILVDLLKNRYQLPQIISEQLLDRRFLKSTTFVNGRLTYTLAVQRILRSLEDKIRAKKQQNNARQIGNICLCIWVDSEEFGHISDNTQMIERLRDRTSKSKWLKGVLVCTLFQDTSGSWEIKYIKIGNVIDS